MKELELILQAVAQLGEAGKDAFIWWLVMDKGLGVIGWLGTVGAVTFVLLRAIVAMVGRDQYSVTQLRDEMRVGAPGNLTSEEYQHMIQWIRDRKDVRK